MLGLPKSTELSKQLPKTAIYRKFNMSNAEKEKFDADISRLSIVAEISPQTLSITVGETVQSVYVLLVSLKKKDFSDNTIIKVTKLINQNMLLVLECEGESKLAIYHTKLIQSEWKPTDELQLSLNGLNLDEIWESIVVQVGGIYVEDGNTLEQQIVVNEQQEKLKKEIERLEKLARKETQPKKKFELVQKIKKLKEELLNG